MKNKLQHFSILIPIIAFSIISIPTILLKVHIQPMFLLAIMITLPLCMAMGYKFSDIQQGMAQYIQKAINPIVFMLSVGAMIGVWNICGTTATITSLGMQFLSANIFLPAAFLLCLIFAVFTGTAFGTCGTIGVALMAIAAGLNITATACAGAIITGAYIGYSLSPLSDYNNLVSSLVGKNVFSVIKMQFGMLMISSAACFIIYSFVSHKHAVTAMTDSEISSIIKAISTQFHLGAVNFIPIIIVLAMLLLKAPSVLAILCGLAGGIICSTAYQGVSLKNTINAMWEGPNLQNEAEFINSAFNRGGMQSMAGVTLLFILAFALMGIFETCGITAKIMSVTNRRVKDEFTGALSSLLVSVVSNLMSASGITSCVVTLGFLHPIYINRNLDIKNLICTSTLGGVFFTLIIPWHSNAINPCVFLGVSPSDMVTVIFIPIVMTAVCFIQIVKNHLVALIGQKW